MNQNSEIPFGLSSQAGHIVSVNKTQIRYTVCRISKHIKSLLKMLLSCLLHKIGIATKFETMPTPPSKNWQTPSIQYENVWICSISFKFSLYSTQFQCKDVFEEFNSLVVGSISVSLIIDASWYCKNFSNKFCKVSFEVV